MSGAPLFSVREALLGPGGAPDRLLRALAAARRFLAATSAAGVIERAFDDADRRALIGRAVRGRVHAGFLIDAPGLDRGAWGDAARAAGFPLDPASFASTVLSRELGARTGTAQVPTRIFAAGAPLGPDGATVEVFVPRAEPRIVRRWIEEEAGTHVGLTLGDPAAFPAVREAFLGEGFRVPAFMHDLPIANAAIGARVIYFDRPRAGGTLRVEILLAEGGDGVDDGT
jgi:hypothetical protein